MKTFLMKLTSWLLTLKVTKLFIFYGSLMEAGAVQCFLLFEFLKQWSESILL